MDGGRRTVPCLNLGYDCSEPCGSFRDGKERIGVSDEGQHGK